MNGLKSFIELHNSIRENEENQNNVNKKLKQNGSIDNVMELRKALNNSRKGNYHVKEYSPRVQELVRALDAERKRS